ncbi:MAG: hypothetical protein Q8O92_10045 [Candidatus Latescibacter sp.]|nr:hypothetical protein [Candidatus Latescibacter sp.]
MDRTATVSIDTLKILEKLKVELVKWVAGLLIAQAAVVVAMVAIVLKIMLP